MLIILKFRQLSCCLKRVKIVFPLKTLSGPRYIKKFTLDT